MPCGLFMELAWAALNASRKIMVTSQAKDSVHIDITLLPVLTIGEMVELLKHELENLGWDSQPDGSMMTSIGGATTILRPDGLGMDIHGSLESTRSEVIKVSPTTGDTKKTLDVLEIETAAKIQEQEENALKQKLVLTLDAVETDIRRQVQTSLNRVYKKALETKAKSLGEVESVVESGNPQGTYEVAITVKA